jgi:hypothetical protein
MFVWLLNLFVGTKYLTDLFACDEIILSAGVFGSPHILLLSGIGPKEHLNNLNVSSLFQEKNGMITEDLLRNAIVQSQTTVEYVVNRIHLPRVLFHYEHILLS